MATFAVAIWSCQRQLAALSKDGLQRNVFPMPGFPPERLQCRILVEKDLDECMYVSVCVTSGSSNDRCISIRPSESEAAYSWTYHPSCHVWTVSFRPLQMRLIIAKGDETNQLSDWRLLGRNVGDLS